MKMNLLAEPELLLQRVVFDGYPHKMADDLLRQLGKIPPNEEGADLARKESKLRVARALRAAPELDAISEMMATVLVRSMLKEAADALGEELVAQMVHTYHSVIRSGALVVLANLLDAEVIRYTENI
ncbi:hypothetical protein [Microbispora sp. NPDC049633]|uniref:hypothetical protein n=1 Tax=Microbispora sp. NPDC049633 TaxID=3154355 RepID=UPI0034228CBD